MGRGPLSEETKQQRALAKLQEAFGATINIEDLPKETPSDLAREATAVVEYHDSQGKFFKERNCKNCGEIFAFKWNSNAVAYCSITCAASALEKIGLVWDPTKHPSERWGAVHPLVVPPQALRLLKDQADLEEDQNSDITHEVH